MSEDTIAAIATGASDREAGLRDNTVLWYCGDNGTPPSAARTGMTLRGQKATMYEGGIRIPAIVRWPGVSKPGHVDNGLHYNLDLPPTLAEMKPPACKRHPSAPCSSSLPWVRKT